FVPLAFISGLSGQFYRQFAVTIAISTVISAINSLTLSPALAALLLKPHDGRPKNWFFRGFNRIFGAGTRSYSASLGGVLSRKALMMGFYVVLLGAAAQLFNKVPDGFVPTQDKQYLIGFAQLPDGATLDRTEDVMRRMGEIMMKQPGVENAVGFPGLSINGFTNSSNSGIVFATLKSFEQRKSPALSGGAIAGQLNQQFAAIPDAFIVIFPPPPVPGLGTTGGFKLDLEDRASLGYEALDQATKAFLSKAYQAPELAGMFSTYQANVPQLYADVERTRAPGISYDWREITYQEILAGHSAVWVYPLAIFLVFLVLAALYESLALPLALILIVPMGLLAALTGVWLTRGDNNVFPQIGFMV